MRLPDLPVTPIDGQSCGRNMQGIYSSDDDDVRFMGSSKVLRHPVDAIR